MRQRSLPITTADKDKSSNQSVASSKDPIQFKVQLSNYLIISIDFFIRSPNLIAKNPRFLHSDYPSL